jgi:DNA-directed RNA polymerase subunit H (RpoH/RPB5)
MGKITAYVDEEIWNEFKRMVLQKTDGNRAISKELGKLIENSLPERVATKTLQNLGLLPKTLPSAQNVKQVIPRVATSAGKIVRKMRDKRVASLSR